MDKSQKYVVCINVEDPEIGRFAKVFDTLREAEHEVLRVTNIRLAQHDDDPDYDADCGAYDTLQELWEDTFPGWPADDFGIYPLIEAEV